MPAHIVDGGRTVVEPVRQRRYLVERTTFGQLLECAVDVSDGLFGGDNTFTVQLRGCSGTRRVSPGGWDPG
ncbi:hypothetical protein ACQ86N_02050 [Puia sp. P3]|uniref:hypothetical protein n=1 Tax=Puia sp. P3 TaxID=3423952 RepID=UPI003D666AAE